MKKGNVSDGIVYHAGFPNAGEDRQALPVGLESMIVKHRASTFLWRLEQAIEELGWSASSIVVVDRALQPRHGDTVVAIVNEEFVVRLYQKTSSPELYRPNGSREDDENISLWGVVTYVIQAVR